MGNIRLTARGDPKAKGINANGMKYVRRILTISSMEPFGHANCGYPHADIDIF